MSTKSQCKILMAKLGIGYRYRARSITLDHTVFNAIVFVGRQVALQFEHVRAIYLGYIYIL